LQKKQELNPYACMYCRQFYQLKNVGEIFDFAAKK